MSTSEFPRQHPMMLRWRRWGYGAHGRYSDYWRTRLSRDPTFKNLRMVVEVVLGGDATVRACTDAGTGSPLRLVSGNDGSTHEYWPILREEPEVDMSYSLGEATSEARSVEVAVPNRLVDAADLVGRGRLLAGYAEVALADEGGDWDERIVLLRGDMDDGVTFGDLGASMLVTSVTDPKASADLYLTPWVTDTDRWVDADASALGLRYPLVANRWTHVPCLPIDTTGTVRFLVAYRGDWTVDAVFVNGTSYASGHAEFGWSAAAGTDALGVPVTLLSFTGTHTWDFSEAVHATVSGGLYATTLIDAVRSLARDFTTLGAAGLDDYLFATAEAKLGQVPIRLLVNASDAESGARTLEYIEGELLASFPMVSMVWDLGGYGPIVTDRREGRVALKLQPGVWPLLDRASDVQEAPKTSMYNRFTVRYSYNALEDTYEGVTIRSPDNSTLCAISRDECGERHMDPIESRVIFDSATADLVADWLVEHLTLPGYYVEYEGYPVLLLWLTRGDNVELTDSEFGWTDVRATVERIAYRRGKVTIGLRVWWRYYALGGGSSTGAGNVGGGN